jgi:hypothetical protein
MSMKTHWSFFYQAPIGVLVTVAAGYGASLFMAPPRPEKVRGYVLGQIEDADLGRGTELGVSARK